MLHLCPVERIIYLEVLDHVFAEENPVMVTDVMEFDGEAVGGSLELAPGEEQGRRISLLAPPAEQGGGMDEFTRRDLGQDAQNVEVRIAFLLVAGGSGAVKNDGDEPVTERRFEAVHDLVES
jgi:hypothetical protein